MNVGRKPPPQTGDGATGSLYLKVLANRGHHVSPAPLAGVAVPRLLPKCATQLSGVVPGTEQCQ
jgi:hypothetical protein